MPKRAIAFLLAANLALALAGCASSRSSSCRFQQDFHGDGSIASVLVGAIWLASCYSTPSATKEARAPAEKGESLSIRSGGGTGD